MRSLISVFLLSGLLLFPALGLCDLILPPCEPSPTPLSASTLVELMLGEILENGVSLLLVGSLAVVGAPWLIAGLGLALLSLPGKLKKRL